jgi:hypothetical protein
MKLRLAGLLLTTTFALSQPVGAQKAEKIDSILVELPIPKAVAMDRVLAGFASAGLDVTDNSGSLVESDVGAKNNALTGANYRRSVRALVITKDATATRILLTGIEARDDNGRVFKRIRIDNRAGGNGEKVWCQLVAVAVLLDSTQVSPDARKVDKCAERLKAK